MILNGGNAMILNNKQIEEAYRKGDIIINPYDEKQVQAATYDFRVGAQGATTSSKKLIDIKSNGFILLQPGDFGVINVMEELKLGPQYVGRFGLRSKYARKGLIATTGPQIDPGYHGKLILGVTNLTPRPISIPYKDDFVSVEFHRLEEPSTKPYTGPYQGKMELGAEEIEAITENEGMALSEVITTLRAVSANVGKLTDRVQLLMWAIGIGVAALGIIIALK
jgi:dCTP deaminase